MRLADHPVAVLSGLAEAVLDVVLERDDAALPFAEALARYRRTGAAPAPVTGWRTALPSHHGDRSAIDVLKRLDRDLLSGLIRGDAADETGPAVAGIPAEAPRLELVGVVRTMPSLELGADGAWHVASGDAPTRERGPVGARPAVPSLASRYPTTLPEE